MDFLSLAKKRCSTRSFLKEPIKKEHLDVILEAARVAPTNGNMQNFMIHVLTDEQDILALSNHAQIYNATTALIVVYDKDKTFKTSVNPNDSSLIDTGVILTHMMLAAADLDIGSVWISFFKAEPIRGLLKLPNNMVVAQILALGYPKVDFKDPQRHKRDRKTIEEIVVYHHKEKQ